MSLNSQGYAGYHDWKLPTVEEATSLVESSISDGQYIDPVFSNNQRSILTGDKSDSNKAWHVEFKGQSIISYSDVISDRIGMRFGCKVGLVRQLSFGYDVYVRPVRSME